MYKNIFNTNHQSFTVDNLFKRMVVNLLEYKLVKIFLQATIYKLLNF